MVGGFRNFTAILILLLGSGCTGAQIEANRMQKVATETTDFIQSCFHNIAENPEYASLRSKTYFGLDTQFPLQMLNDKTSPNKQDIALLYKAYGDVQDCRKIALDGASRMHPLVLLTLVESYAESDKLWAEATSGRLTWGKFNEGRKALTTQGQARMI